MTKFNLPCFKLKKELLIFLTKVESTNEINNQNQQFLKIAKNLEPHKYYLKNFNLQKIFYVIDADKIF